MNVKIIVLCLVVGFIPLMAPSGVLAEGAESEKQEVKKEGEESQSSGWFQKFRDIGNRAGEEFSKAMSKTATAVTGRGSDEANPEEKEKASTDESN